MQIIILRGRGEPGGSSVKLSPNAVFCAIAGWPQQSETAADEAAQKLLEAIVHMVTLPVPLAAHAEAVRRWLVPSARRATLEDLRAIRDDQWQMAKELLLAKMLHECGISSADLRRLADPKRAPLRSEFAAAFGLELPRATRWRAPPHENRSRSEIEPRVRAAGNLGIMTLEEALTAARPDVTEAWRSPLAYFIQSGIDHFAETYTHEGIAALASYLRKRREELGGDAPIVEVGAGSGQLSYLLNQTGLLTPAVIATDPTPQPSEFKMQRLSDEAAIKTHQPAIMLCAWMTVGEDWTAKWRRGKVTEYVLIGCATRRLQPTCIHPSCIQLASASTRVSHISVRSRLSRALGARKESAYSLSECFDHSPYERHLLKEVSANLLGIEAGQEATNGGAIDPGWSRVCAIAFRRPQPLNASSSNAAATSNAAVSPSDAASPEKPPLHGDATLPYASPRAAALCRGCELAERLRPGGYAVIDHALDPGDASELHVEMLTLLADGEFSDASTSFRSDHISFMREDDAEKRGLTAIAGAIRLLKGVAHEVAAATNSSGELTTARRVQCACYPGRGTRYEVHSDVRVEEAGAWKSNWRVWTAILYANEGWRPENGGCLRLHANTVTSADGGNGTAPVAFGRRSASGSMAEQKDIEPLAGRLLIFDSLRLHEVMPSWRERFALTMWIWREDDDEEKYYLS